MKRTGCRFALAAALALAATGAAAQSFPAKPVRIVVPFGPGSGTDTATRIVGQHLSAALKQSVITENRPGASGSIAAVVVARAAPDGYTLLMGEMFGRGVGIEMLRVPYASNPAGITDVIAGRMSRPIGGLPACARAQVPGRNR